MNLLKNQIQLLGHTGMDPEIKSLEDGRRFAIFSMATNSSFHNAKGELEENTYWHQVIFWHEPIVAVIEKYVSKGSKILIRGSLTTRSWEDEAGLRHYRSQVVGKELLLL